MVYLFIRNMVKSKLPRVPVSVRTGTLLFWRGTPWAPVFLRVKISNQAERKGGQLLSEIEKHPGGNPNLSHDATGYKTLSEIGLNRTQSSRWQMIGGMDEIEPYLEEEARKRQAHGQTAPGRTLAEKIPQPFRKPQARDKAAEIAGTNRQYVSDALKQPTTRTESRAERRSHQPYGIYAHAQKTILVA